MTLLRTTLAVSLLYLTNATVHAQPAIAASDGWVSGSAAYLTVSNPTMYDIYLVSATSDVAGKVELRDGEKVVKDLTVPSFGSLELKAGGPHLMLLDLRRPLKTGEIIEVTLTTDAGIEVKIPAAVK
jgi:copper(I)-binding protein